MSEIKTNQFGQTVESLTIEIQRIKPQERGQVHWSEVFIDGMPCGNHRREKELGCILHAITGPCGFQNDTYTPVTMRMLDKVFEEAENNKSKNYEDED